ncbi:MAG: CPBP family intramembrane glutamic endopeptidase [Ignavibacteria bacterium]
MSNRIKPLIILIIIACLFWLEMFVLKTFNFWLEMTIAASLLAALGLYINHRNGEAINYRLYVFEPKFILIGIFSAAFLYLVFYSGDIISKLILPFADRQVVGVYNNKSLLDPRVIGLLLLFIIGPAEEVFWRGYVQDTLAEKFGDNKGWIIASLIYGGVHIVAMNFMLFMAALICGLFWGWVFKRYRSVWPGLISHALWDLTIFVLLPVR